MAFVVDVYSSNNNNNKEILDKKRELYYLRLLFTLLYSTHTCIFKVRPSN